MSYSKAIAVSRAPMLALTAVGTFWGTFAASVPDLKQAAGLSDADMGLALLFSALGGFVAMYLSPRIGALLGRRVLPVSGALLVGGYLLLSLADGFASFAAAMLFSGLMVALLDVSANVRISVLEERHNMPLMNVNHAMFSFAFAGGALVTGIARRAGYGPDQILPVMALAGLALAVFMHEGRAWRGSPPPDTSQPAHMPWMLILLTGGILFASFIGENATEAWSALLIERTLGAAEGTGGFGPSMLGLAMGVIRLLGQAAARWLGEGPLILWSAILGVVGALTIALAVNVPMAIAGVAVMGAGMAVIVPCANSLLGRLVRPDQRSLVISRAWMVGFVGFFIGPSMMGLIAEHLGLRMAFIATAMLVATIIPSVLTLMRASTARPVAAE
ncbi:MFS transporter [Primorskyibacter marinus]|uniref:MFS transporter n=1 Tax=Primorskyibacter marinus TaxID=1977320 RepID=UPI000E300D3C|nr:MFS transporter [Primorskyibacter marinus]